MIDITPGGIDKSLNNLAFWLKRWKRYPLGYVIECIGDVPTYQQAQILNDLAKYRFVVVKSGHGIGKTKTMAWCGHWYLDTFFEPGKPCRVPITGAAFDQLTDCLWPEMAAVLAKKKNNFPFLAKRYELQSGGTFYNTEWKDGWFATLRTAREEKPDALQGFHDCFFMIDEWSGVPDKVFEVARGAMGDPGSMGLMMGNPTTNAGYGYNIFNKGSRVWRALSFSSLDSLNDTEYSYDYVDPLGNVIKITHTGRQTRAWAADMKDEFGENSNTYKVRVLGEFGSGNKDCVIEPQWIKPAWSNPKPAATGRRIMGVDVARSGNDDTSVVIRDGRDVLHTESWHGADLVESQMRIIARQAEWNCHEIGVDIIGVGSGLYDQLRFLGYPVFPVVVSEKAPDGFKPSCKSLRDALWWKGRMWAKQAGIHFCGNDKEPEWSGLAEELSQPTYSFQNGHVVVESKDDMKARGAHSPNRADAFLITLMHENSSNVITVKKPSQIIAARRRRAENWRTL